METEDELVRPMMAAIRKVERLESTAAAWFSCCRRDSVRELGYHAR
jgi:hypothetical protein